MTRGGGGVGKEVICLHVPDLYCFTIPHLYTSHVILSPKKELKGNHLSPSQSYLLCIPGLHFKFFIISLILSNHAYELFSIDIALKDSLNLRAIS